MQLLVEVKGAGFHFTAATDQPEDVVSILNVAMAREAQPGNSPQLPLPLDFQVVAPDANLAAQNEKSSQAQAAAAKATKPKKSTEKVVAMPQEAAPAAEPPAAPPPPEEPVAAAPAAANGHPNADQIRRDATQACVDALTRNRVGVQALLTEFGVSRFRDLGDNLDKLQAFQARVSTL